jgi:aspartokinase
VLHYDAARIAKERQVRVFIKSSFSESSGTEIGVV